jgi:outer membrane biosynthesis protein TonB
MYDSRRSNQILVSVLVMSLAVHIGAWTGLSMLPTIDQMIEVFRIDEVSLVEEPPPPPVEEPEPEPEAPPPEPEPPPPVRRERPEAPPPEAPPDEPPPPAAEEQIEDFTGETLTNDTGEGWTSAVGSGAPMDAPIGGPTGVVTGRHRAGTEGGEIGATGTGPAGPRLVALRDLSQAPAAPSRDRLTELIRRFYPGELRTLTIEGSARVHLRIGMDGAVSRIRVRSETHEGFGEACVHVLQEAGSWAHPLDRDGNPVATEVNFECNFSLRI